MIEIISSQAASPNRLLKNVPRQESDDNVQRLSRQLLQQGPGVPEVGRIPPRRDPALSFPPPPFPRPSPQGTLEAPPAPILSRSRPRSALRRAAVAGGGAAGEGWPPGGVLPGGRGEKGFGFPIPCSHRFL